MKKIGLLGGISHYTTIEYYSRIMDLYSKRNRDLDYPEVIIYSLSHGEFKNYEDMHQIANYVDYIGFGVDKLISAGADIIALAANSPHRVLNILQERFDVKFISALDSAFNASQQQAIKKGLLLGIKFTMQSTFYQERFNAGGIDLITPNTAEQDIINDIIFKKLINGQDIDTGSKQQIIEIILKYPTDGVVLGCMRLPVFFNNSTVSGFKLINTLEKHIEDILDAASLE